jgi:hypothetical protein
MTKSRSAIIALPWRKLPAALDLSKFPDLPIPPILLLSTLAVDRGAARISHARSALQPCIALVSARMQPRPPEPRCTANVIRRVAREKWLT